MAKRGNGEGTIYYSEKLHKWIGQFTAGRKADGSINRKSVYGDTRKDVKEKMTKALSEIQTETFVNNNDITLIELATKYVEQLYVSNKIIETTYSRKKCTLKNIENLSISRKPIQKITISELNAALSTLTIYANSNISKIYELIAATYNYAMILQIIKSNPFQIKGAVIKPKSKKNKKKIESLIIEEQKLLEKELKKSKDKYKDIIYIALYTGMRIGEILALNGSDINMNDKVIYITKTLTKDKNGKVVLGEKAKTYAGTREVPFLDILSPILKKYTTKGICFEYEGSYVAPSTINTHFKKICKDAGIKQTTTKKTKPNSKIGKAKMEGLVARPKVELQDRLGNRVIVKIKVADFRGE